MQSATMLNEIIQIFALLSEDCHYAECRHVEYHHYAECHQAECRQAECGGAFVGGAFLSMTTCLEYFFFVAKPRRGQRLSEFYKTCSVFTNFVNRAPHIRHQCRKKTVFSCHRCLINSGVEKMNNIYIQIRTLTTRCL